MKKFAIVLFTLALLASASACSADKTEEPTDTQTTLADSVSEAEITTDSELTTSAEDGETSATETTSSTKEAESTTTSATAESKTKENTTKEEKVSKKAPSKKTSFSDLRIGMSVNDDTVNSLGTVIDKQNAPSCHFDGNDTIYCYNGYKLYTYMDNGAQKLYLIEIDGSSVKTAKGASVGMTVDKVKGLYGEPEKETGTSVVYSENGANVRFTFNSEDVITLIEYEEK